MMYVSYAGKAVHGAPSTVGLPRMHKEPGERRDFLPDLVTHLEELGAAHIVLEHGYGSGMDIDPRDYDSRSTRVRFGSYQECLEQDLVLVLRCPSDAALQRLEPGQLLVSMLHPRSRPERVELLAGRGVHAVRLPAGGSGIARPGAASLAHRGLLIKSLLIPAMLNRAMRDAAVQAVGGDLRQAVAQLAAQYPEGLEGDRP